MYLTAQTKCSIDDAVFGQILIYTMKLIKYLFLLFPLFAASQKEDSLFIKKIADEVMVNGQAYNNLRYLTKNIGGRLTASPQAYRAEAWGANVMKQSGADKVTLQQC